MDLADLYKDVIVDHNRSPRNFRPMLEANRSARGVNPLCGDRLTVYLHLDGDRIADVSFEGSGCAISVASASLMTEALKGLTEAQAGTLFEQMHDLLTADEPATDESSLGKLAALSGVREFPSRVKCASLCWHAVKAALEDNNTASTE